METLQSQVSTLSHKIDALYQVIEQLNSKVSQLSVNPDPAMGKGSDSVLTNSGLNRHHYSTISGLDSCFEHKDVLVDRNHLERNGHGSEQDLTPEIQIQRLTAQLTAAYNRIAALEEQLLSHRIH